VACLECHAFHRPENCPKVKARRRRQRLADKRFYEKCFAVQAALAQQRREKQA